MEGSAHAQQHFSIAAGDGGAAAGDGADATAATANEQSAGGGSAQALVQRQLLLVPSSGQLAVQAGSEPSDAISTSNFPIPDPPLPGVRTDAPTAIDPPDPPEDTVQAPSAAAASRGSAQNEMMPAAQAPQAVLSPPCSTAPVPQSHSTQPFVPCSEPSAAPTPEPSEGDSGPQLLGQSQKCGSASASANGFAVLPPSAPALGASTNGAAAVPVAHPLLAMSPLHERSNDTASVNAFPAGTDAHDAPVAPEQRLDVHGSSVVAGTAAPWQPLTSGPVSPHSQRVDKIGSLCASLHSNTHMSSPKDGSVWHDINHCRVLTPPPAASAQNIPTNKAHTQLNGSAQGETQLQGSAAHSAAGNAPLFSPRNALLPGSAASSRAAKSPVAMPRAQPLPSRIPRSPLRSCSAALSPLSTASTATPVDTASFVAASGAQAAASAIPRRPAAHGSVATSGTPFFTPEVTPRSPSGHRGTLARANGAAATVDDTPTLPLSSHSRISRTASGPGTPDNPLPRPRNAHAMAPQARRALQSLQAQLNTDDQYFVSPPIESASGVGGKARSAQLLFGAAGWPRGAPSALLPFCLLFTLFFSFFRWPALPNLD